MVWKYEVYRKYGAIAEGMRGEAEHRGDWECGKLDFPYVKERKMCIF
jgi:hypothetical protein